jgi:multiple sugar transport system permease protein
MTLRQTSPAAISAPGAEDAGRPVPHGGAGQPVRGRRDRRPRRGRPFWMLAPGGTLTLLVVVIPFLVAVYISFLDLDQYTFRRWVHAPFIGIDNYVDAWRHSDLLHAVWVSGSAAVIATVVALPVGMAAALTTHNRFPGRAAVRSIYLIPYVLPAFVVGTVWRIILAPDGVANNLLHRLGLDTSGANGLWLNGPRSYWALIAVQIWASWPLIYLLVLAGLQNIDHSLHEAAALDGAGWWTKLRSIVVPHLRGPVALGLLITVLHIFNSFTLPFVLFGVPSPHDVEVLPVLTYVESFQNFRFGLSAAMAVVSLLLILIPLLVYLRAVRLDVGEDDR